MKSAEGIILAAGLSSRTGSHYKMTLPLGRSTVLEHSIKQMLSVCTHVFVVTGHNELELNTIISEYSCVTPVKNTEYEKGMFSSVRKGVSRIQSEWFFLSPADMPFICETVYKEMSENRSGLVLIPEYNGKKGHPVLCPLELRKHILNEPEESNLRKVIRKFGFSTLAVDNPSILYDIDSMEDYKKAEIYHDTEYYCTICNQA